MPSKAPTPLPTPLPTPFPTPFPTPQPTPFGSISGRVGVDTDNDGVVDELLGDFAVDLYILSGIGYVFIQTTSTNANGEYTFTNLVAQEYYLEFLALGGFRPEIELEFTSVLAGEMVIIDDIVFVSGFTISGVVGGDPYDVDFVTLPLLGVTVQLNGDDGFTETTTTSDEGEFFFQDILPDAYSLEVPDIHDGYETPETFDLGYVDSPFEDEDFIIDGNRRITGFVGIDTNGDSEPDDGVAGVTIFLYGDDDSYIDEVDSDTDGSFSFSDLYPVGYKLGFNAPSDYDNPLDKEVNLETGDEDDLKILLELI